MLFNSLSLLLFFYLVFFFNYFYCNLLHDFLCSFKQNIFNKLIFAGGPLLCQKNNRWTIYGITSFGEGCGRQGKYGIYAKVPNYTDWIERTIDREEKNRQ